MSKGKWKKGPINPRITLYLKITRAAKKTMCGHCGKAIEIGTFYIRLSSVYGNSRYWVFCLAGDCFSEWAYAKLNRQALDIEEKRGYNPLDNDPYYPKGKVHLGEE